MRFTPLACLPGPVVTSFARPGPLGRRLSSSLVLAICGLAVLSGCATHRALVRITPAANGTLSDIYYQQVLDNVARFMVNPDSLPSFAMVTAGTVNVEDERSAGFNPTYNPTLTRAMQGGGALPILSLFFGTGASRRITENWSTTPVTDADNLRRLRCAFQLLVGTGTEECDQCVERLRGFFLGSTESLECALPTGWFMTGSECDVPSDACYVSHCGDLYVWVEPWQVDGFTRFTISILDIATGEIHAPLRSVVKTYRGAPEPGNLQSTEVTTTEVDHDALKSQQEFHLDRQRPEGPQFNRGLFFVPR